MRGATVLVVDDDAAIRGLLSDLLHTAGFAVETVVGGEDAIRVLETRPYDCVIVDYALAGWLNGLDLLRELRAVRPSAPIVMLTSNDDAALKHTALAAGAFAFETKPIESIERFLALMARAAATHRTAQIERAAARHRRIEERRQSGDGTSVEAAFRRLATAPAVYALLLEQSLRTVDAACGFVARWHSNKRLLEIVCQHGLPTGTPLFIPVTAGSGPVAWVVQNRLPLIEDDLTDDALRGLEPWLEPPWVVITPVTMADALLGICVLNNSETGTVPRRSKFDRLCRLTQSAAEALLRSEPHV